MNACKDAYNEEFEVLADEFENIKKTLDEMTKQAAIYTATITSQEEKIASLERMISGTGHDLILSDKQHDLKTKIEGVNQEEVLDYIIELQDDPENPYPETRTIINEVDTLLSSPFSFFGLSLTLNSEQQIDIQNRCAIRFYKMKIN